MADYRNPGLKKKKYLKYLPVILILLGAAVVILVFVIGFINKSHKEAEASVLTSDGNSTVLDATVYYNGKNYKYNDHLTNYLFLGIDNEEQKETKAGLADAGQADTIFLLSYNRMDGSVKLLSIPRDTMTEVESFDLQGNSLGTSINHLNLAYAYGDGSFGSCQLQKEAVSNLLYGVPIQNVCALNMDVIPVLAEAVGELTVTVPDDSLESESDEFPSGAQVVLTKDNTEKFLRGRDTSADFSAINRQNRQNVYLQAYKEKAAQLFARDPGFITDLYLKLSDHMVTSMSADQFAEVMEAVLKGNVTSYTLPGESVATDLYDEYHVDETALYELILNLFYEETDS